MNRVPVLSIVTITYNEPEALAGTLESLSQLMETDFPWEHVIVDSSPTANHGVLLKHPAKSRIVHIEQSPKGIYPAMNAGLRACRGDFIWFLNGGDKLKAAENLRAVVEAFRQAPDFGMALARAELTREGKILYSQRPRIGLAPLLGINRICHQALLFRKEIFSRLGEFSEEYRLASDYEFHLRALAAGIKTLPVDQVLVQYDMGGQSSQIDGVFAEFRRIHTSLRQKRILSFPLLHRAAWRLERLRIGLFRALGSTPIGPQLKSAWYRCRRLF
ncbi:MAG: glycosyltransferase [Bdellovibrionota bacterium]